LRSGGTQNLARSSVTRDFFYALKRRAGFFYALKRRAGFFLRAQAPRRIFFTRSSAAQAGAGNLLRPAAPQANPGPAAGGRLISIGRIRNRRGLSHLPTLSGRKTL
jgi:hypothetical protein